MLPVTVIIPEYRGGELLKSCVESLIGSEKEPFPIIIVDDNAVPQGDRGCTPHPENTQKSPEALKGSHEENLRGGHQDEHEENLRSGHQDEHEENLRGGHQDHYQDIPGLLKESWGQVTVIINERNLGFAASVNRGIRAASTPYVILLNNDTIVRKGFVSRLYRRIRSNDSYFSCQPLMLSLKDPDIIDSAGDFYCLLGWARARGSGKSLRGAAKGGKNPGGAASGGKNPYLKPREIFSACGGAAIYRRELLLRVGLFDEAHFAYLEDVDIGWRARIMGYKNVFEPSAVVLHAGSASSGSRHNAFKVELSAGNSLYMAHKNMPGPQYYMNLPFLITGHLIKLFYFLPKGLAPAYIRGIKRGRRLIRENPKSPGVCCENKEHGRGSFFADNKRPDSGFACMRYIKLQMYMIKALKYLLPFS